MGGPSRLVEQIPQCLLIAVGTPCPRTVRARRERAAWHARPDPHGQAKRGVQLFVQVVPPPTGVTTRVAISGRAANAAIEGAPTRFAGPFYLRENLKRRRRDTRLHG